MRSTSTTRPQPGAGQQLAGNGRPGSGRRQRRRRRLCRRRRRGWRVASAPGRPARSGAPVRIGGELAAHPPARRRPRRCRPSPPPPQRSRALSSRSVFGTDPAGRGGRLASWSFRTRAASDETISGRAPAGGRAPSLSGEGGGPGTGSRRKRRAMKRRRPSTAVDGGADDDNRCCSIAIAIVLLIILLSPILKSQSSFRAPGPPFDDVPPLLSFAADPPFIICHPSLLPLLFRRIRLRARAALCLASFALPAANRLDV